MRKAKLSEYKHLLSADHRKWNFLKDEARYYEVTPSGKVIRHEKMSWLMDSRPYQKYFFGRNYEKLILEERHEP